MKIEKDMLNKLDFICSIYCVLSQGKKVKIVVSETVEKTKCYFIEREQVVICHDLEDVVHMAACFDHALIEKKEN